MNNLSKVFSLDSYSPRRILYFKSTLSKVLFLISITILLQIMNPSVLHSESINSEPNAQRPQIPYSVRGKESYLPNLKIIFSQYGFVESGQKSEYILELSKDSFRVLKSKGNILLNKFDTNEKSLQNLHLLLDAESGYTTLFSLRNNGSSDHKMSDVFCKAEIGKEGARVGESIELEYTYRSKNKKDGYLTIVLFTTDGTVAQVFPNKFDPDNKISPNESYKFPSPNAKKKYRLEASPPVGNDRLILIVTPKPIFFDTGQIKNYGFLTVLEKNIFEEMRQKKDEILSLPGYHLQELVLDIKE